MNILKFSFIENFVLIFDFNSLRLRHATPFLLLLFESNVILKPFISKFLDKHITALVGVCQNMFTFVLLTSKFPAFMMQVIKTIFVYKWIMVGVTLILIIYKNITKL